MAKAPVGKKLVRSKSGMKIVEIDGCYRSPFLLSEPHWVPDKECSRCTGCQARFDFLKRRHHCRRCGQIYCSVCSGNLTPLPRMCFLDPVRLCARCSTVTTKENEFFDKQLKALTTGSTFKLLPISDVTMDQFIVTCKLSPDYRFLEIDGMPEDTLEPIDVNQVISLKIKCPNNMQGTSQPTMVTVTFSDQQGVNREITLDTGLPSSPTHKTSRSWIVGLQKAMNMIFEARDVDSQE
ncbi:PREDICTED: zinc finger FYVE domain-containing protein 21-like [Priapulus caudatus]|uniref:Zinc finger FYVE domain-containing protein 21-like n=1 Tax=Priapulus caudatus TaxID=37621 RepID=A0ABM1EQZ2_PRICU|nr:PREDICTED: zinc finger FYVE domain-containing protein 21-like [Priapulus caudatus]